MMKLSIRVFAIVMALVLALGTIAALGEAAMNGAVAINEKNFPDAKFRAIVKSRYDKNKDGKLSPKEADAVDEMYVGGKGIQSLKGIEHFKKLEQLSCRHNKLQKLDLSKNKQLWALDCDNNNLKSLKLGRNSQLSMLNCFDNPLEKLDIGGCPRLLKIATNEMIYASESRAGYGSGKDVLFNADIRTKLTNGHKTVREYRSPKSVKFSRKEITLRAGRTATLDLRGAYVVTDPATSVYPFTLTNGNDSVLEMTHKGFYYIKGLKKGRSVVTVNCGGKRASVTVIVE